MKLSLVGLAVAALASAAPGVAQEEADDPLGEVTVTARFRQENLQETPLAITAVNAATLEARGATDVTQLAAFVPNAIINPLGAGWGSTISAFIRGVGLGDNSLSFEPGVPIYVDDVYIGRPQGAILDLLDLERVEVLRGPQGTLFGKNAVGGTVRLVSKKPQGDGSGHVEATVGEFNRRDFRGSWDVALVPDTVFARFSASSKKRDGYVDVLDYECVNGPGSLGNGGTGIPGVPPIRLGRTVGVTDTRGCVVDHLGGESVQSARAAFRWIASDAVEVNFTGDYTDQNQQGPADKYTVMDPTNDLVELWNAFVSVPVFGIPWDQRFLTDDPYTTYNSYVDPITGLRFPNVNDLDHWGLANTVDWDLGPSVHFKSITGYRRFSNSFGRDSDGSPLPFNVTWDTSRHRQFSQEFQLTGTAFERLDWTVGAFYYDAKDSNQGFQILGPELAAIVPDLGALTFDHFDVQDTENYAGFIHGVYRWNDRLSTTLGVRYTDDKKHAVLNRLGFDGVDRLANVPVDISAKKWSPKVSVEYRFRDELLGYLQWSTGFRGGGFGPRPQNQFQVASFQPEDLKTTELGMKSEWLDRRIRFNSAVFYSDYTNQQQQTNTTDVTGAAWFRTVNSGTAEVWGVEGELVAQPTGALRIEGSFGYLHYLATDVGPVDPITGVPLSGLCIRHADGSRCVPSRTPEWTYGASVEYTIPLGSAAGSLTLRGDTTYQDDVYFTDFERVGQEAYSLYNARITWQSAEQDWSVALFGTNLTDEVYFNGKLSLIPVLGFEQGNVGAPRQWGLTVKRSF